MQDKDLKDTYVTIRANKQILDQIEQAQQRIEQSLGKRVTRQQIFEYSLAFFLLRFTK
jgi:hypothetical protein